MVDILPTVGGDGGPREAVPVIMVNRDGGLGLGSYAVDDNSLIRQAINEIYATYGDIVSVSAKAKSLRKFGRTLNANIGARTTIAELQDAEINETFATGNTIDSLVSTDAGDNGKIFTVEGHTQNLTTGAFTFATQNVTCLGISRATLATPLARANRMFVALGTYASPAVAPVGDIAVYDNAEATGLTAGKPDVDSSVKLMILGASGKTQSEKCATTISFADYWIVTTVDPSVANTGPQDATVLIEPEYRQVGGVWLPVGSETYAYGASVTPPISFKPYAIVPKNSDFRVAATSDKAATQITCRVEGYLASIVG